MDFRHCWLQRQRPCRRLFAVSRPGRQWRRMWGRRRHLQRRVLTTRPSAMRCWPTRPQSALQSPPGTVTGLERTTPFSRDSTQSLPPREHTTRLTTRTLAPAQSRRLVNTLGSKIVLEPRWAFYNANQGEINGQTWASVSVQPRNQTLQFVRQRGGNRNGQQAAGGANTVAEYDLPHNYTGFYKSDAPELHGRRRGHDCRSAWNTRGFPSGWATVRWRCTE